MPLTVLLSPTLHPLAQWCVWKRLVKNESTLVTFTFSVAELETNAEGGGETGGLSVAAATPPGVPNATSFGPAEPSIVLVYPSCA